MTHDLPQNLLELAPVTPLACECDAITLPSPDPDKCNWWQAWSTCGHSKPARFYRREFLAWNGMRAARWEFVREGRQVPLPAPQTRPERP